MTAKELLLALLFIDPSPVAFDERYVQHLILSLPLTM